ncbi:MAG: restriction endonuclease subunit S [Selenomonadaceae bacterium]|nr:restriction endonuclease subunit S [Selenomonadaceae bacterium]
MAKKLEEIKEEECPYELPEGWKWKYIADVSTVVTGSTPSKKEIDYYSDKGGVPFFKPADLDSGRKLYNSSEYLSDKGKNISKIIPSGSTLVCCIGTIGKSAYMEVEGTTNQQINAVIPNINNLYMYYFSNTDIFINQLLEKASAITISIVNKSKMESCYIPIPPKETQQKIVDIIESLFAKLDIAQEKVEHVLAESENRRSAILHNAFSGKLTEKWREENNVSFDSWNEYKIKDIAKNIKDKYDPEKDKFLNIPYIGLEHIEKNNGIVGFSSSEGVKSIKTLFNKNDVLYGKLRPYLDKHDIAEYNGMCSTDIIVYRCKLKETAIILNYVMSTKQFIEYAVTNSKGINLPRTSEKIISEYKLQLPLLTEQKEIVRLLDKFLSVEDKVKSTCQSTLEAIATMRKSILAKAFRGELVS